MAVIHKRAAIEAGRIEEQSTAAAEPISKSTEKFSNKKCYRCGGPYLANSTRCKARFLSCRKCEKLGHIARVCKFSKEGHTKEDSQSNHIYDNYDSINTINRPEQKMLDIDAFVDCQKIHLLFDTGSAHPILCSETVKSLSLENRIMPSSIRLASYTGDSIPILSQISCSLDFCGQNLQTTFQIVRSGKDILGLPVIKRLKLLSDEVCNILTEKNINKIEGFMGKWTNSPLFTSSSCAKNFSLRLKLKDNAEPKRMKVRPVPFRYKKKVAE